MVEGHSREQVILPAAGVRKGRGVDGVKLKEGDIGLDFEG